MISETIGSEKSEENLNRIHTEKLPDFNKANILSGGTIILKNQDLMEVINSEDKED